MNLHQFVFFMESSLRMDWLFSLLLLFEKYFKNKGIEETRRAPLPNNIW